MEKKKISLAVKKTSCNVFLMNESKASSRKCCWVMLKSFFETQHEEL